MNQETHARAEHANALVGAQHAASSIQEVCQ
jgi:hypothetical protein